MKCAISTFSVALALLTLLAPSLAFAGYHDVCGTVFFTDTRIHRYDTYGSKLDGDVGESRGLPRLLIHLYDMDGNCQDYSSGCAENDDDLLATTYTNTQTQQRGDFCFPDIGGAEDIYFVTRFSSDDNSVWTEAGSQPVVFSYPEINNFGSGIANGSPYYRNWNVTCPDVPPSLCSKAWADEYNPLEQAFANLIASMVDVDYLITNDSLYHANGHTNDIRIFYPEDPYGECDGSGNEAVDCNYACIGEGQHSRNGVVAHEVGHILQMRALNVCGSQLHDCDGGHQWDSYENEKCATGEGWANFVSAATYWEPYAGTNAGYEGPLNRVEGDTNYGANWPNSYACVSLLSSPHRREGNVTRFFWDLYDTTTIDDDGTDSGAFSFDWLLATWDEFPAGTGNNKANESGSNGRNVRDFLVYENSGYAELGQNCLSAQTSN